MDEGTATKKIYTGTPGGRRPRFRWFDDVDEQNMRKMQIRIWRTKAENREARASIVPSRAVVPRKTEGR